MKWFVAVIFIVACYVGGYYALLVRTTVPEYQQNVSLFHKQASYRWDSTVVHKALAPLHAMDRHIRPDYWATKTHTGFLLTDDIQYFAPGPEFKLANEAAAMKAAQAEQAEIEQASAILEQQSTR